MHVWLATGHSDMCKGIPSLVVQEALKRDQHSDTLFVFRRHRGDLI
ncbi:IS66 family insertion sequence element accessory protein TnpB [Microvirga sp. CF3062]